MTGLAPTSSSFYYQWTYDVFINFRGEDTRHGFTGHLYNALKKAEVHTFIDDEEIRRGDEITPTLLKAIENSRMAITVFSKNYASSKFCLNELVQIHECIKMKGRLVLPIFYDVDPSEVRHQTGNYENALSVHMENDKIQSWKLALYEVANIGGYHLNPGQNVYEYQLIERIVKDISSIIDRVPLHIVEYPVGLESRVLTISSLLQIGSTDEVIMVGICGSGGMGKTTIARVLYNSIDDNFEGLCFLHDVKELSMKIGLERIQEIILSQIVGVDIKIQDDNEGVEIMKTRLKQKKILLILDNVDNLEQLKKLAGDCNWFSGESRIIITTRDKNLLVRHGVESIYNMEAFSYKESLKLLSWNAFKSNQVNPSYMKVLNRAVSYAKGLPLALEVIGSNLCERTIDEWESMLDAYKRIPSKKIQQVLKVSYEGLEQCEKEIFLDIACSFNGEKLEHVKYMAEVVHGHNNLSYSIRVLEDKCLIKKNYDRIEMHDLIRDMGREIVREESPNKPGKRSRLWFHQDIVDILEDNTGTDEVRMIVQDNLSECIKVNWDGEAFKSMKGLKILIFKNVKFSESPKYLPNSLKVLIWKGYPSPYLPPNFYPKKLVVLDLGDSYSSSLETLKILDNLGVLNLGGSVYVSQIPDLSNLINLKELNLLGCKNLIEIHDSIGYLAKIEILNVRSCVRLETFPRAIKLPSLRELQIGFCSSLTYFPEIREEVKIRQLSIFNTGIEKLPLSICNLSELTELWIVGNKSLMEIPNSIFLLPKVKLIRMDGTEMTSWILMEAQQQAIWSKKCDPYGGGRLRLRRCSISDDFLRTYPSRFTNVQYLDLSGNNFTILPAWFKEFHSLADLILNECKHLREVEGVPPCIQRLYAINCVSLSKESKSLLLSEKLLRRLTIYLSWSKVYFWVPSGSIPEWFHHRSKGASISFWFRNSFPPLCLCLLLKPTNAVLESNYSYSSEFVSRVSINNEELVRHDLFSSKKYVDEYHLFAYYLKEDVIHDCRRGQLCHKKFDDRHLFVYYLKEDVIPDGKRGQLCRKNKWNHVQIYAYLSPDGALDHPLVIEESGMHVIKQRHEMEDITFTNPCEILDSTTADQDISGEEDDDGEISDISEEEDDDDEITEISNDDKDDMNSKYINNNDEQLGTTMKEKEVTLHKKTALMGGDNFASSSTAFRYTERGRNSSIINLDDNDVITPQIPFGSASDIINNQEASLMDLDLNTTSLPMLPWAHRACDSFRNQGPCWESPFYDQSASDQDISEEDDDDDEITEISNDDNDDKDDMNSKYINNNDEQEERIKVQEKGILEKDMSISQQEKIIQGPKRRIKIHYYILEVGVFVGILSLLVLFIYNTTSYT